MEFLSAAAALVTIAAFLTPYVGIVNALLLDGVLLTLVLIVLRLWTRSRMRSQRLSVDRSTSFGKGAGDSAAAPTQLSTEQTIVSKSFDVETGKLTKIELPVEEGDYVFGRIEEEDRQWFSWYIVDIKNLRKAEQKRSFDYAAGEDDVPSTAMDWTAPSNGPWYLVLDVSMKQYVRRVTIVLKRRPKSAILSR